MTAPFNSIPKQLFENAQKAPYSPAYYEKKNQRWLATNWRSYAQQVRTIGRSLIHLGVGPGNSVSIIGFNRPEWVLTDVAAMSVGACAAGVYTTCSPEEIQYIVDHADARVMLVETPAQAEAVRSQRDKLPKLKQVVAMRSDDDFGDEVMSWEDFLALAEKTSDDVFDERLDALEPQGLATLIYTSGTTGPPKGVMLSHENLAWTAAQLISTMESRTDDTVLSFLPLSHIAEQMVTIHGPIAYKGSVYFAESLEAVPENLKEVQPTIFFAVPRLWEKFHAKLTDKLSEASGIKEHLISFVQKTCTEVSDHRNRGKELPFALELRYKLAKKLVLDKLKPAIGLGKARFCVSGAAPISAEILEFFASIDIVIHEVYGQSEDTGPTTLNLEGRTRFGSVGPAVPGVEVKIAEDGEILVKGKNVSPGYYKDEDATKATFKDGWLHSGDLGEFDGDGFLSITGRKKDIIITAGGKNIAPKNIEASLKNHRLINEAVVIGDRRKFLSALITVDEEAVQEFLGGKVDVTAPKLADAIKDAVEEVNKTLARVETIKKWTVLPRNFGVEEGELTPTLKVKRRVVNEHFADEIEAMYR